MKRRRFFSISLILITGLFLSTLFYCDKQIKTASRGKTYFQINEVPHNHVGLLLGTGKYIGGQYLNPYYKYRIDAATSLMKSGKIDYLVISGDNSRKNYNEPEMMMKDLVASGVDSSSIYLDYAGFRTFDSIIRFKEIFSQDSVTLISQEFHNQRAIFIAQRQGIVAVGFNAQDVSSKMGLRTQLREKFARIKVFVDYLFNTKPKFLGPKIKIP